jgi:serine/threonine protein kinase/Tfp pilus assembly protein PilF
MFVSMLRQMPALLADRYRIERELGAGGMATVYLAHDLKHDRAVAIKVLRDELAASIGPERFLLEIKTTARLTHPHILPLHDSGEVDGMLYYVMPYVDGETLRARMDRERRLPVADAIAITKAIADALGYAHAHGVVHRDIKPENVLFLEGVPMVTDFGIARATSNGDPRMTSIGVAIGTPAYMSPEQSTGEDVDARSDQYALASMLYEMLTGEAPFIGPTPESILVQRFTKLPPKVTAKHPSVPRAVEVSICTAMARDATDRFPTIDKFAESLTSSPARPIVDVNHRSVAVLPFANMSGDPSNEYFSDGVSEEIINALAQLPGVHVPARTSAFSYKGKNVDLRTIGEQLSVATVLEGSVRKSGNRIRITAQLVNVADGYQLWSERYDRELTDVFAIQDEIASAIAGKLDVTLGGGNAQLVKPPTRDIAAYDVYLKGRALVRQRGASLPAAADAFEQAIALDPEFSAAYAGLAQALVLSAMWGLTRFPAVKERASEAIDAALSRDPNSVSGHIASGILALCLLDRERACQSFTRAVALDPSDSEARAIYALYDRGYIRGSYDGGLDEMDMALLGDPRGAHVHAHKGLLLAWAGRFADAADAGRRACELDPGSFYATWALVHALNVGGDLDEASVETEKAIARFGRHSWLMMGWSAGLKRAGRPDIADALFQELEARARTAYVQPMTRASAAFGANRIDDTFRLLNEALEDGDPLLALVIGHWRAFDPLREHPAFDALLQRMGWTRPLPPAARPPARPA